MLGKALRDALHTGQRVYGTLVISPSARWPKTAAAIDLDFVFIDTEHNALDRNELNWMCQAYALLGIAPVVRIPNTEPDWACMALDAGAQGIIAPYTETPEQVQALAGAIKYRPLKGQRVPLIQAGQDDVEAELVDYIQSFNANNVLIVNIESVPALQALDDILAVEGLDAVLVGPHDLSASLGIPGQYRHPRFIQAVDTIIQKARVRGIGAGIHATFKDALEQEIRWAGLGANLIIHLTDQIAYRNSMRQDIDALKQALGDPVKPFVTAAFDI